jgi:transcriptional regulator with XRE-family HTH domain
MDIEKLGQNIKYYRMQKKLTQKDLGSKISKTESSIRKYEKGIVDIPNKVISEIADALDVSMNDLLGTSEAFESDFNIEEFDDLAKSYVLKLRKALERTLPSSKISNTLILQNLVIKQRAERDAQSFVKLDRTIDRQEFRTDRSGNIITGEKLYAELYEYFKNEYFKKKLQRLENQFQHIASYEGEALDNAREYYNNIPKEMIPDYILKKIYPEYLYKDLRKDTTRKKFLEKIISFAKETAIETDLDEWTIDLIREYYEAFRNEDPGVLEKYLINKS